MKSKDILIALVAIAGVIGVMCLWKNYEHGHFRHHSCKHNRKCNCVGQCKCESMHECYHKGILGETAPGFYYDV